MWTCGQQTLQQRDAPRMSGVGLDASCSEPHPDTNENPHKRGKLMTCQL